MSLAAAVTEIQSAVEELTAIREVTDPKDMLNSKVTAVVWPGPGVIGGHTPMEMIGKHQVTIQVLVPRKDTARNIATLSPFIDSVPEKLFYKLWNSKFTALDHFETIAYEWMETEWAKTPMRGIEFVLTDVQVCDDVSA